MNGVFHFIRFVAYGVASVAIRKSWNWLTADIDPIPGSKEFGIEYHQTKQKYIRLNKKKEEYNEANRQIGRDDD